MAAEPITGNATINNLRDKRHNLWQQACAVSDRAYEEDRDEWYEHDDPEAEIGYQDAHGWMQGLLYRSSLLYEE